MSGSVLRATCRLLKPAASRFVSRTAFTRPVRSMSTYATKSASTSRKFFGAAVVGAVGSAAAYGLYSQVEETQVLAHDNSPDWSKIREEIVEIMDNENHDDGSLGPLFVRLAWHASGTFCQYRRDGGSNGAGMRFPPESTDGANNGLDVARRALEPVKRNHPGASYADIWTFAGAVAVEEMGGPKIEWKSGRIDFPDNSKCPKNGRLPDATQGESHVREVFYRMGFNDREMVALIGAHTLGRCHTNVSGFAGPWTRAPTTFSNLFFVELFNQKWSVKKWGGPKQYEDESGDLMMLPTDMCIVSDETFRKYATLYAKDEDAFFADFASAFSKLLHLGCTNLKPCEASGEKKKSGWFW
eukprot:Nk52_evm37s343 gene=Nk52_evmTU37s343